MLAEPPLYQQIRDSIRSGIASRTHAVGDKLPSEAELAETYSTTRTTVRQALSQLVFEGLVVRQNGRGTFVAEVAAVHSPIDSRSVRTFEDQVALTGRRVTYGPCSFALDTASAEVARRLRIAAGSEVFKLERVRLIEGKAVCLERRSILYDIGLHVTGEMLARMPVFSFVSGILKERMPTLVVSITAELASKEIAARLGIPENAPLIVRDNTHHASDGTPKVWGRSIFRGDVRTDYVLGQPLRGGPSAPAGEQQPQS